MCIIYSSSIKFVIKVRYNNFLNHILYSKISYYTGIRFCNVYVILVCRFLSLEKKSRGRV